MPPSPGSYNSHGGGAMGPPPPHHPGMPPPPPPTSTPTHDIHEPSITTTPPGKYIKISFFKLQCIELSMTKLQAYNYNIFYSN